MRHRRAHALVFLVSVIAALSTAHALALDVVAEVLTPVVDAQPRQAVSLQVRFTNTGPRWQTVVSSLAVPGGWVVLVPPEDVTLAPGEARITLLTVLVAPDAGATTYTFPMAYRTSPAAPPGEALFAIRVPAIDQVALAVVESPALIPSAESHSVHLVLRNDGNTPHDWDLTASSSMRLPVTLTPSQVTLAPGDATAVVAFVAAPERLTQQQTHALTVTATSRSSPDVSATARATVLLVPTNLPVASALHTFPLTLRASYASGTLAATAARPRLALEVSGSGTVNDRDPGRLGVRLRMTPANPLERVALEYQRPTWGVRLGHQDVAPSPLSSSVRAFGVSSTAAWPLGTASRLRAELAAYLVDGAVHLGVAASAALPHGVRLDATLSGVSSELLGTVGIRYAPEPGDAAVLHLARLEGTYGVRVGGGASPAQALRVAAQVNAGPSFARLTYDTAAAGFDARDRHHASLRLAATLRLDDALAVPTRIPLSLSVGYDHTWAWDDDLAHRLLPPAAAQRQEQRYTVGAYAGLGPARVSVSYGLTHTSLASHDTQHELRTLVRTRVTDDFTVGHSAVWIRRLFLDTLLSEALELQTLVAIRTPATGLLTASVTSVHDLGSGLATALAFGVKWAGEPTPDLRLSVETTLHLFDPDKLWDVGLDVRYLLADQRVLTTTLSGRARPDGPLSLTFELGVTVPVQIPVGRRSDIGRLEGSITRPDGRGLSGAIVTVAGQAVTTTPDGAFVFPALPIGEHLVQVVTAAGLGAGEYLSPGLPAVVLIRDDATTEQHFMIEEAATVVGRLVAEAHEPADRGTVIAPNGSADRLVRGVRIELRNGVTALHTFTDSSGAFRFQRVPAGDWTLLVLLARAETDYRLDPSEVRLALEPGGADEVVVRLVPIVRHIQFSEGGVLQPLENE